RAGRYFSAEAVLTSTTRLPERMNPRSTSSGMAARVAAPSGDQANRRSCHWAWITVRIASSDAAIARPPVCLRLRKTWYAFPSGRIAVTREDARPGIVNLIMRGEYDGLAVRLED